MGASGLGTSGMGASGISASGMGDSGMGTVAGVEEGVALDQSLVPAPQAPQFGEPMALTPQLGRMPVELDVSVPIRNFRVRNLLALELSHLVESGWGPGEDVPLAAGDVQLAWSEFEVVDTQLAVRVTRLT
jgi:flagellar motor switch/type III secretory pathway protein FliN